MRKKTVPMINIHQYDNAMKTQEEFQEFYQNNLTDIINDLQYKVEQINKRARQKIPQRKLYDFVEKHTNTDQPHYMAFLIVCAAFWASWVIGVGVLIYFVVWPNLKSSGEEKSIPLEPQASISSKFYKQLPSLLLGAGIVTLICTPFLLIYWLGKGVFPYQGFKWAFLGGLGMIYFIGVPMGIRQEKEANIRKAIKNRLIRKIINFLDPNFKYNPKGTVAKDKINNSLTLPRKAKQLYGEDYVQGKVGKTEIEFSEVIATKSSIKHYKSISFTKQQKTIQQRIKNNVIGRKAAEGNAHFFKGLYFIADFNKEFQGHTVIRPTQYDSSSSAGISKHNTLKSYAPDDRLTLPNEQKLTQITLEDPELEEDYNTYTTDPQQALYVLSTSTMERLKAFHDRTNKNVFLSFYRSHLHLAIPYSKDLLDAKTTDPDKIMEATHPEQLLEKDELFNLFHDLQFIIGIVEDFNLNTRIWNKS